MRKYMTVVYGDIVGAQRPGSLLERTFATIKSLFLQAVLHTSIPFLCLSPAKNMNCISHACEEHLARPESGDQVEGRSNPHAVEIAHLQRNFGFCAGKLLRHCFTRSIRMGTLLSNELNRGSDCILGESPNQRL